MDNFEDDEWAAFLAKLGARISDANMDMLIMRAIDLGHRYSYATLRPNLDAKTRDVLDDSVYGIKI